MQFLCCLNHSRPEAALRRYIRSFMKPENYEWTEKNGMRVILEFSEEAPEEKEIKREVKEILNHVLREYCARRIVGRESTELPYTE